MKFNNKPNTCIKVNNTEYWVSRSIAVVGIIGFKPINENKIYFPVQERGLLVSDSYKLCLPCGYIDYNESIEEALRREYWEETGINLTMYKTLYGSLDKASSYISDPNDSKVQNVTFTFEAILECESLPTLVKSDESGKLFWMSYEDVLCETEWAFNHRTKIEKLINEFNTVKLVETLSDDIVKCVAMSTELHPYIPDDTYEGVYNGSMVNLIIDNKTNKGFTPDIKMNKTIIIPNTPIVCIVYKGSVMVCSYKYKNDANKEFLASEMFI